MDGFSGFSMIVSLVAHEANYYPLNGVDQSHPQRGKVTIGLGTLRTGLVTRNPKMAFTGLCDTASFPPVSVLPFVKPGFSKSCPQEQTRPSFLLWRHGRAVPTWALSRPTQHVHLVHPFDQAICGLLPRSVALACKGLRRGCDPKTMPFAAEG